jgi:hypothetical protein
MTTRQASKKSNQSCSIHIARRGLRQPLTKYTAFRPGRRSATKHMTTAIGVYFDSVARAIEILYLLAAFGVLGGIPLLLNLLIRSVRRAMLSMRGSQARIAIANTIPPACSVALTSR